MTAVVTSCSAKGWKEYGRRFVETFDDFWPPEVHLHIVSEDLLDLPPLRRKLTYWGLSESDRASEFFDKHVDTPWVAGQANCPRPKGIGPGWQADSGYWFRWDAYKFSKKVFAIDLVATNSSDGRLLWIDADTLTFAPVPIDLVKQVLPEGYAVSCLTRGGYHSECGFVGYNLENNAARHFIKEFARLYSSGEVFTLAEWHDSWVFDWLRHKLVTPVYEIPHRSSSHPFINSALGLYMDHLKGNRKKQGRSLPQEQQKHHHLPYWQKG